MMNLRRGLLVVSRMAPSVRYEHKLPPLPFKSDALEPIIKCEIMELHHQKHHATYVANLNAAEAKLKEAVGKGDVNAVIALQPALKFNGGGHLNHSIFWQNLSPNGGDPEGPLLSAICSEFGSLDALKTKMMAISNGIQGSGWGWLGLNKETKRLQLVSCANQDPLEATTGLVPLLGIDVWEHAYYLQYKNARAEYTKKIFEVVNWADVGERYSKAIC
ncbi:Superoxide dismutase [Cu-Zn] [Nesidiocoris tenuis]|uniref:Superoxide dismutase n=1 Tax=Nesidiocoris tenuis TaxID=355587 RepID=A0ABN7A632_9HEMI|nr:Superoxide dismutase [Cu-Zn] [Nesidiocoris tenuis]